MRSFVSGVCELLEKEENPWGLSFFSSLFLLFHFSFSSFLSHAALAPQY